MVRRHLLADELHEQRQGHRRLALEPFSVLPRVNAVIVHRRPQPWELHAEARHHLLDLEVVEALQRLDFFGAHLLHQRMLGERLEGFVLHQGVLGVGRHARDHRQMPVVLQHLIARLGVLGADDAALQQLVDLGTLEHGRLRQGGIRLGHHVDPALEIRPEELLDLPGAVPPLNAPHARLRRELAEDLDRLTRPLRPGALPQNEQRREATHAALLEDLQRDPGRDALRAGPLDDVERSRDLLEVLVDLVQVRDERVGHRIAGESLRLHGHPAHEGVVANHIGLAGDGADVGAFGDQPLAHAERARGRLDHGLPAVALGLLHREVVGHAAGMGGPRHQLLGELDERQERGGFGRAASALIRQRTGVDDRHGLPPERDGEQPLRIRRVGELPEPALRHVLEGAREGCIETAAGRVADEGAEGRQRLGVDPADPSARRLRRDGVGRAGPPLLCLVDADELFPQHITLLGPVRDTRIEEQLEERHDVHVHLPDGHLLAHGLALLIHRGLHLGAVTPRRHARLGRGLHHAAGEALLVLEEPGAVDGVGVIAGLEPGAVADADPRGEHLALATNADLVLDDLDHARRDVRGGAVVGLVGAGTPVQPRLDAGEDGDDGLEGRLELVGHGLGVLRRDARWSEAREAPIPHDPLVALPVQDVAIRGPDERLATRGVLLALARDERLDGLVIGVGVGGLRHDVVGRGLDHRHRLGAQGVSHGDTAPGDTRGSAPTTEADGAPASSRRPYTPSRSRSS